MSETNTVNVIANIIRIRLTLVGLVALCGASAAFAANAAEPNLDGAETTAGHSPNEWIEQMSSAYSQLDYDGVFSFLNGTDMASLRVVHMNSDGVEKERLVHLNGAPREIIRDGDKVICILQPGDRLMAMGKDMPAGPFARAFIRDFGNISENYELAMRGEDRIASRVAVRMIVEPRDTHRYGYRLWLDKETGLLLKSELMDESQQAALEVFQFSQITIGTGVEEAALKSEQSAGAVVDHLEVAERAVDETHGDVQWQAKWLPEGFKMASADLRHAAATDKDVSTLMYSDGLAAVSVFVEDMPNKAATNMLSRKGATVAVTQLVIGPKKGRHLVTVIGEVPPMTAKEIASNISYQQ